MKDVTAHKRIINYINNNERLKVLNDTTKQRLEQFVFNSYKDIMAEDEYDMEHHTATQNLEFAIMINLEDDPRLVEQLIKEMQEGEE